MANITLDYYNDNSDVYFTSTVNIDMTNTYKDFLKLIPENGKILDLGCGSGRDSKEFINRGYKVTAVDGSEKLAKEASKLIKQKVIISTFQELKLKEKFDGIWACASLLHINRDELKIVLRKLYENLKDDGIFYMSFKYGDKEYIDDKNRYFNCYTDEGISKFINENTEFSIIDLYITEDKLGRIDEVKWLNVICKR